MKKGSDFLPSPRKGFTNRTTSEGAARCLWGRAGFNFPSNTGTNQITGSTLSSQENKTLKTRQLDRDVRNLAGGNYS